MRTPINDRLNRIQDTHNTEHFVDAGKFQTYALKMFQSQNPYTDIRDNSKFWIVGTIERAIGHGLMTLDYARLLFDRCMVDDKAALSEVWHLR